MKIERLVGVGAAGVAVLGIASAAYQVVSEARDRRKHPPPGRLVDIGGYRLHVVYVGQGNPAVVIVPALGATAAEWQEVQQRLAQQTTVCVYDRAGLGHSDPPKRHRTVQRMAQELHALLHAAGIAPPYVLAGHSMGGWVARVFLHLYPDEVAGLALIDSSHPEQSKRLPKVWMRDYPGGMQLTAALEWTRPLGWQHLARDLGLRNEARINWASNRRGDAAELWSFNALGQETAKVAGSLGDLPLAVLTSSEVDPNYPEPRQRGRSRFYKGWVVLQGELASLSTDSTHVRAERGGHHLNRDNPELVYEVIGGLVERVRTAAQ
jgi:pimeloyl-ACP methyl ester carboxylesterase